MSTATDTAVPAEAPAAPGRLGLVRLAALVLIVLPPIVVATWSMTGDFVLDDFAIMALTRSADLPSLDLLTTSWFGHLMPAGMLTMWVETRIFGLSKPWFGLTQTLGMFAVMAVAWSLFRRISGFGPRALLPLALLSLSTSVAAAAAWWANAIWMLPLMLTTLLALRTITGTSTHQDVPRATAWCLGYTVAALAFTEKAVLLPAGLFAVDMARRAVPWRQAVRATWRVWRTLWVTSILLVCCYLLAYRMLADDHAAGQVSVADGGWAIRMVTAVWSKGLPAGNFGGPINWSNVLLAAPPTWFALSAALVTAALVAWLIAAGSASRRLLLFSAAYLSLIGVLLAGARFLGDGGALSYMQVRYYADATLWLAVTVAFAAAATPKGSWWRPPRWAGQAGAALIVGCLLAYAASAVNGRQVHAGEANSPIARTVRGLISTSDTLAPGTVVLDTPLRHHAPFGEVDNASGRAIGLSGFYNGFTPSLRFEPGAPEALIHVGDGRLVPARTTATPVVPEAPVCLDTGNPTAELKLPSPLPMGAYVVQLQATSAGTAQVGFRMGVGTGGRAPVSTSAPSAVTWVEGFGDLLTITLAPGSADTCIDSVAVGVPTAR